MSEISGMASMKMTNSGIQCRVVSLKYTNVSDMNIVSIIRGSDPDDGGSTRSYTLESCHLHNLKFLTK
jgi:hypothetical protein